MKRFSRRQLNLILAAVLLSAISMAAVPLITRQWPGLTGLLCVFAVYWVCYCIPVAIFFREGDTPVRIDLKGVPYVIPAVAIALPVGVAYGAGTIDWMRAEPAIVALAVGAALLNGSLEELAWRRPFRANSGGRISFELIGLFLFTLWHVPLYLAEGVSFDRGAIGLVGGSLMLGAVWMVMTRSSNSVGWPIASHILVNIAGFIPLFALHLES